MQPFHWIKLTLFFVVLTFTATGRSDEWSQCGNILFHIGRPDAQSAEFRFAPKWQELVNAQHPALRFVVGKNRPRDWSPSHISTRDMKNAGHSFTFEIEFKADRNYEEPLYFIIGAAFAHPTETSQILIDVNGKTAEPKRQPKGPGGVKFNALNDIGYFEPTVIELPNHSVVQGTNQLRITLRDGSWLFYDYLVLCDKPSPPQQLPPLDLKKEFRAGSMKEINEILFVVRKPGTDEHWYANFGYYAADDNIRPFPLGAGAWLNILNVDSGEIRTVFEDKAGTIRDPQLHYDGQKIIFSYLPAGKKHFNLYEINLDGTGLRQITDGDWDDIEPTYTAEGDIIFCSSRVKRWVQCWLTPVATLHRCGPNGENIREVSANVEHDNTPWPLHNGQILYTRWEYVDRSQVHYHHLWTMNPDGTRHSAFYGNLTPGVVMIDAKPIENSHKIVASFSPGHGRTEHYGWLTLVDPTLGPDHPDGAVRIGFHADHADPWAFSENAFLAARRQRLELVNAEGREQILYELPDNLKSEGFYVHEPRPIKKRQREMVVSETVDWSQTHGRLALVNIYEGRRMRNVKAGSIKELLVLETLPEPIHYSGGMDQISSGGTFTLERIMGTVPVQPDGSAFMELPALRSFLFVAMDHEGKPVKRMHSFTNVMPGETSACIGCHEPRTQAPTPIESPLVKVLSRSPVRPKPIEGIPDVFDFPRDIQPILDKHCVSCHNIDRTDGGVNLVGDWGLQFTFSYISLSGRNMFGDNRNKPESNFEPYKIGSASSKLMKLINENHGDAKLSDGEKKIVRYWLDAGANYAGTYAANGTGQIGWSYRNKMVITDENWQEVKEIGKVLQRRCNSCHTKENNRLLPRALTHNTPRYGRHWIFNLTHPEKSLFLTAPLSKTAGGKQHCGQAVFENTEDADYKLLLAAIERGRRYILEESNRFSMKPFYANEAYTREMIRYGILPPDHDRTKTPIDPYAIDRKYWESLWYSPQKLIGQTK
ncbi:MAG: hypothetical protein LBQ50_10915 [Planctomycetaceae bacterium]|jgi:mono/diheme cytochrome c family protein|nr:hypothetical protein [Planctomycetaceae bacterium]